MSVDWSYLPQQPMRFFQLKDGFDRRDLKRAYGKLIKKFKPESHPNEFQKIRQAYEQLEQQVRYGVKQKTLATQTKAWDAATTAQKQPAKGTTVSKEVDALQHAIRQPRQTFARLSSQASKSPQEFFILAAISDLLPGREENGFLKWLLKGVKTHPHDPGLQQLLSEYLRMDVKVDLAANVLQACSKSLSAAVFYRMTEPLWDRLARETDFTAFAKLLNACEKDLKHRDGPARVTFYLHVARRVLWRATPQWLDNVFKFLNTNGANLDGESEQEFEFLETIREYMEKDRTQIEGSPVRKQIDDMIRSYCEDEWSVSLARVAQIQDQLARNSHGIIDSFPLREEADDYRLLSICMAITDDVIEQTACEFGESSRRNQDRQSFAALNDLREGVIQIMKKLNRQKIGGYVLPFLLVTGFPVLVISVFLSGFTLFVWSALSVAISLVVYFLWLKPKVLDARIDEKLDKMVRNTYCSDWRPRLFRYIQSCGEPPPNGSQPTGANRVGRWRGRLDERRTIVHTDRSSVDPVWTSSDFREVTMLSEALFVTSLGPCS